MLSRTSFFNFTLFRKDLERSWPLWGGVTLLGALVPLYLVLGLVDQRVTAFEPSDFTQLLYMAVAYFLPVATFCYAVLCGMMVWSYLHNSRSTGMMHSLPIGRTGLFVTSTLSGLAMLLIPYVVVGALLLLMALFWGGFEIGAVGLTILAVISENILFFSLVTLCAMVSGSVIGTGAFYLIMNFAAPVVSYLVRDMAREFIFGLESSVSGISTALSPLLMLLDAVGYNCEYLDEPGGAVLCTIENYWVILVYGLVGLAILGLSFLFYHKRRSESAGDLVAVPWLKPVFRFGVAGCSALTVGRVLYLVFWEPFYQSGGAGDLVAMGFFMVLAALLGYYAASMLLQKSLRVFKGSLRGAAAVAAACALLTLCIGVDFFGIERRVPAVEDIETVTLDYYDSIKCDAASMPGLAGDIVTFHKALVEDRDYVRSFPNHYYEGGVAVTWANIRLRYVLTDGSTLSRRYSVPMTSDRIGREGTYDSLLMKVLSNSEAVLASVAIPEDAVLSQCYLEKYNEFDGQWSTTEVSAAADVQLVYDAILRDAREGNFSLDGHDVFVRQLYGEDMVSLGWLSMEYYTPEKMPDGTTERTYGSMGLDLRSTMVHTIAALKLCGVDLAVIP